MKKYLGNRAYQESQGYKEYQGYQDYQNYQGYQDNSFQPFYQQRRFQQEMASTNDQWSNGIRTLNEKLDAMIHMVQQQSDPYFNT